VKAPREQKLSTSGESELSGKVITSSPEETESLGERLAGTLLPGAVVALFGELGAGKTCFIRGACRGLEVEERVTSPSFIIVNHYRGRMPVYHIDLYRLRDTEEFLSLGYEEYLFGEGVTLIEWAEKAEPYLPRETVTVSIEIIDEKRRAVSISPEVRRE
jgi:tRNA threonylcarbamoyladenosine biosynthesis protein TsaE